MSVYRALAKLEEGNRPGALCTVIRSQGSTPRHAGSKMLIYPDGSIVGTIGGGEIESRVIAEACQALLDGKPRLLEYHLSDPEQGDAGVYGGQLHVFIEPLHPKPTLVVIGGGHVGKAVAHLGHWLGFRVVINDDRSEFCTPQAVPDADEYIPGLMTDLKERLEITPSTYIVLTTRGVDVDVQGLPALLESPARYVGVIGSRHRWATSRQLLLEKGVSREALDHVHSPIGLELNAETPEEIAVSIMAEIILLRQSGNGNIKPTKE